MILAHNRWDLQKASDGRFVLARHPGQGHNERRFSVKSSRPDRDARDRPGLTSGLLQNGTKLNFKGAVLPLRSDDAVFNPAPSRIRRCRSTSRRQSVHVPHRGEVCDGLHVHPSTARSTCASTQPRRGKGSKASGRKRADFTYTTASFAVSATPTRSWRRTGDRSSSRSPLRLDGGPTSPRPRPQAGRTSPPALHRKSVEGDWQGMADLITDEMPRYLRCHRTYETIGRRLKSATPGSSTARHSINPTSRARRSPTPALIKEFNA